jgi:hypothetical protein
MLIDDVRPTTLSGVKRLAAQLRKKQGLKHSVALDLAAKAASFTNFRNAKRMLPVVEVAHARPYVLLTMYWHQKKPPYLCGRETLRIELSKPILDVCEKSALRHVRGFGFLRMVADDHFVCDNLAESQERARRSLCTAERSLRFMEHTRLLPFRDRRKIYPKGWVDEKLPDGDHLTFWIDPAIGQRILVDEPYCPAPDLATRAAWALRNGWEISKTSWPGMYSPYKCDLYIATDTRSGYDLGALVAKIDAMPVPSTESHWPGESASSWDTFVSPMAKTSQDVRRARCRGTILPSPSATSLPYNFEFGTFQRRPAGALGIEGHMEAGRLIKAMLSGGNLPSGAFSRVNSIRHTLEDWMCLELSREQLDAIPLLQIYYGDIDSESPHQETAKSELGTVKLLYQLKHALQASYPDCAPRRRQINRIDVAVSLLAK